MDNSGPVRGWLGVFHLTPSVLLHMSCGRIVSCPHFIKCGCTFLIEMVNNSKFQTLCLAQLTFVNSNMDLPHTTWSQHIMSTLHQMRCRRNTHTLVQFFLNSFQVPYDAPATYHGIYVTKRGSALFVLMHVQQFVKRQQLLYTLRF